MAWRTDAADYIQGNDHLIESARVSFEPVVQFPDGRAAMASFQKFVPPGFDTTIVGMSIGPVTNAMNILTSGEARAGRNAYWRVGVSVRKPSATRCEFVDIWCFDDLVPRTTKCARLVLVGHDEEKVRRCDAGHGTLISYQSYAPPPDGLSFTKSIPNQTLKVCFGVPPVKWMALSLLVGAPRNAKHALIWR